MPLIKSGSDKAFKSNVRTLMGEIGKSPHVQSRAQALAIAYSTKRRGKADGGSLTKSVQNNKDWVADQQAKAAYNDAMEARRIQDFFRRPQNDPTGVEEAKRIIAQRQGMAAGGLAVPWTARASMRQIVREGYLNGPGPGRTDILPITTKGGAYVLPADHLAALGQGNNTAGAAEVSKMFKLGPDGTYLGHLSHPGRPIMPKLPQMTMPRGMSGFAKTSKVGILQRGGHSTAKIVAAHGEMIIPPEAIIAKYGSLERGHREIDKWVLDTRKKHIKTLKGLKPPKQ